MCWPAVRDHSLAERDSVTWAEAYEHDYITVDKTSGKRFLLDQALRGVRVKKPSICETHHVTTMIGLVEAGLGVAMVPSIAMPACEHPILVSVPLIEPQVMRHVGLIKRRGRTLPPAAAGVGAVGARDAVSVSVTPSPGRWIAPPVALRARPGIARMPWLAPGVRR